MSRIWCPHHHHHHTIGTFHLVCFSLALEASFNNKLGTGDPVMSGGQFATLSPDMEEGARHNAHTSGFDPCVTLSP